MKKANNFFGHKNAHINLIIYLEIPCRFLNNDPLVRSLEE